MPALEIILLIFLICLLLLGILVVIYFILSMREYSREARMRRHLTKKTDARRSELGGKDEKGV